MNDKSQKNQWIKEISTGLGIVVILVSALFFVFNVQANAKTAFDRSGVNETKINTITQDNAVRDEKIKNMETYQKESQTVLKEFTESNATMAEAFKNLKEKIEKIEENQEKQKK